MLGPLALGSYDYHVSSGAVLVGPVPTRFIDAADHPVAVGIRSGLVVDRLRAAGHLAVPVRPNAFHAARAVGARHVPRATPATIPCWLQSR